MLNLKNGSSASNGIDECVYLICSTNQIGDFDKKTAQWIRAIKPYEAQDQYGGNNVILKSCIASEYDSFLIENQ